MTCRDIQRRIIWDQYRRSFVLPNYTPRRWFECDVFEVTEAGYFREYEIKMTRADFRADAAKTKDVNPRFEAGQIVRDTIGKHNLLSLRDAAGPTRFWFVTPKDLVTPLEVPEWAGLIYARQTEPKPEWQTIHSTILTLIKSAPKLHGAKCDAKVIEHSRGICYWRMHGLLLGRRDAEACGPELDPEPLAQMELEAK